MTDVQSDKMTDYTQLKTDLCKIRFSCGTTVSHCIKKLTVDQI